VSPLQPNFKRSVGYLVAGVSAAAVSVAIFAGAQYFTARRTAQVLDNPAAAESKVSPQADAGVSQLKKTSESFRSVAKAIGPAVVNIKSTKAPRNRMQRGGGGTRRGMPGPRRQAPDEGDEEGGGGGGRDPFFDFFEHFGRPFMVPEGPQTSLGSGIIIDKRGYVVTNNHVVEDSSEIMVSLSNDKTDMKAKLIGTDPRTDLAVLKIENGKDFPVAEWADSDQVEVGDWAIAIGSPFDLRQTVTVGIVSAKGRNSNVLGGTDYVGDLIQTDAAINPGNSGGPLCTLEGTVMGVNTAIYTRSGGYMGIGFAIPSNLAKEVVGKLISDGKIVHGWLGVYIQPLDPELAKELGVKDGVGVHEVIEDSPAAKAGLKAGDVLIEVEGKLVKEVNQLQRVIGNFKPGQNVKMRVVSYSDKKTRNVTVKIGELPAEEPAAKVGSKEDTAPDKLGLIVSAGKGGITIEAVQPGSVAEQVGLEPGDVILKVNRKEVNTIAAYKKQVGDSKRLYFEIKRKGRTLFYQFNVPEQE
jgi:serine protease Do